MRPIQSLLLGLLALHVGDVLAQYYYYVPSSGYSGKATSSKATAAKDKAADGGATERRDATPTPGNIFCCDDASGRKVCGDFLPDACQSRAYEVRDSKGFVSRTVEAPLTPEQQARRLVENARKEEEQKKALEERRRTQALLATYSSEKDIDRALNRELAEADKAIVQAQQRLDEAEKKSKKLEKELEFYKGKTVPGQVKSQVRDNETQIKAQKDAVEARTKDKDAIRVKFAEEKRRFFELTGKKPTEPVAAPATEKPPTVAAVPAAAPGTAPATKP